MSLSDRNDKDYFKCFISFIFIILQCLKIHKEVLLHYKNSHILAVNQKNIQYYNWRPPSALLMRKKEEREIDKLDK